MRLKFVITYHEETSGFRSQTCKLIDPETGRAVSGVVNAHIDYGVGKTPCLSFELIDFDLEIIEVGKDTIWYDSGRIKTSLP